MKKPAGKLIETPLQAAGSAASTAVDATSDAIEADDDDVGAVGTMGRIGQSILSTPLQLPGLSGKESEAVHDVPGAAPGIEGDCRRRYAADPGHCAAQLPGLWA